MPIFPRLLIVALLALPAARGTAQFGPAIPLPDAGDDLQIKVVDMDLDGHPDLVARTDDGALTWSRNTDGTGSFAAWEVIATALGTTTRYALADLFLNGLPDLVLVDATHQVTVIANLGNGTFGGPVVIATLPAMAGALACDDITGEGLPDIVVSLPTGDGSGFGWLANTGSGFLALSVVPDLHQGPASNLLLIDDLDEVGGNDVVLQDGWGNVHVHRNQEGDATVWSPEVMVAFPSHAYEAPQLMDVDGDGDLDLLEAREEVVHWAENRLGEGGEWLPFTDHTLEAMSGGGPGAFGRTSCSTGLSVVYRPDDEDLPMRWRTYLAPLQGMAHAGDLPDLPRGAVRAMADLDGDGREDLVVERQDGLAWHANLLSPPVTVLDMPTFDTLCVFGPPVVLPTVEPAGGRWSGPWVINGQLHRSNIGGTGSYPMGHTIYEPAGCPVAGVSPFQLISGPAVTPDLGGLVCSSGPIQLQAQPAGVQWSGIGADGVLDPATYGGGSFACAYTDATGMQCASIIGPVNIGSTVPVAIAPAGPFCITDAVQGIGASIMPLQGGTWSGDIAGTVGNVALFDPSMGAGTYQVILHVEPGGPQQCANSDTLLVSVSDAFPEVTVEAFGPHCVQGTAIVLTGATPAGGTWSGNGIQGGVMEPSLLGVGTHPVTYTFIAPEGCATSFTTDMELVDGVTLDWDADDLVLCPYDGAIGFNAWPGGGTWASPITPDGTLDPGTVPEGTYPVIYTWTGPNCTLQNPALDIEVRPLSEVIIDPVPELCADGQPYLLTANLSGTWGGAVTGNGASVWFDPALFGAGTWSIELFAAAPGACPALATTEVVVDLCSGIADVGSPFNVRVAPNPFDRTTWLVLPEGTPCTLEVFDASGRRVLEQRTEGASGSHALDLGDAPPGPYQLRITTIDGRRSMLHLMKG